VRGGQLSPIGKEIEAFYSQSNESQRLANEWGELERLRTESLLARHLPPSPAAIFDIGGAAGVYAVPLAKQGYHVHLIDPVELHLEQASAYAAKSAVALASVRNGDARHLDVSDNMADAVLLLGPLYHLPERADRLQALREARRILKPKGVLLAAAISRFASLIDGLAQGWFRDPEFRKIVAADLVSGRHSNATSELAYFTTAYFHRPEELAAEVREASFDGVEISAIEGPVWSAAFFREAWNDPAQRRDLLDFLALIEREPSLLSASGHLMAIARQQ
jgi:ubiquinone/menaquinone biosynthesis C-methylase UbiE